MLIDRLRTSAVLIAVTLALLVLDARGAPTGGEGLFLIPLLLVVALGTAWDAATMLRAKGYHVSRRTVLWSVGAIAVSTAIPTLWNAVAAAWPGAMSGYPPQCPVGRLGWPVLTTIASVLGFFWVEMARYRPTAPAKALQGMTGGVFLSAYVGLPMGLLVATRALGEGNWGLAALLSVIAITKSADAGAYFSGKAFGRHKLVPRLSPGKTWEGVLGGVIVSTLFAAGCLQFIFPWLAESSLTPLPPVWLALVLGPTLTAAGLLGDLAESLVKRECGAKDSGAWLPGLGGMWDVTDSLIAAVLPGFLCFAAVT